MKNTNFYLLISLLLLGAKATLATSEADIAKARVEKEAKDLGISVYTKYDLDWADERLHECIEYTNRRYEKNSESNNRWLKGCHSEHGSSILEAATRRKDLLIIRPLVGPSSSTLASLLEPVLNADVALCKWREACEIRSSQLPGFLGEWRKEYKKNSDMQRCEKGRENRRRYYIEKAIKAEIALPILDKYTRCISTESHSSTDCQKQLVEDLRRYDNGGLAALAVDKH